MDSRLTNSFAVLSIKSWNRSLLKFDLNNFWLKILDCEEPHDPFFESEANLPNLTSNGYQKNSGFLGVLYQG